MNLCQDNVETSYISWPNYHSGSNGDYQIIQPVEPVHELLQKPHSPDGVVQFFPAHPHEGGIGVPDDAENARAIAIGKSKVTGRTFNLVVASDRTKDAAGNSF